MELDSSVIVRILHVDIHLVLAIESDDLGFDDQTGDAVLTCPLGYLHPTILVTVKTELFPQNDADRLLSVLVNLEVILDAHRRHCYPHWPGVLRPPVVRGPAPAPAVIPPWWTP